MVEGQIDPGARVTAGSGVLDGVLTVLAEQGIGALSVRSVAAAAGVSPAQVQYYFRTRSELVRAAFDHAGHQFSADIEAAEPSTLMGFIELWLPLDGRRERRARVWLAYAAISAVDAELAASSAQLDEALRQWFHEQDLSNEEAAQLMAMVDGLTVQCLMLPMAERRPLVDRTLVPFVSAVTRRHRPGRAGS